MDALRFPSLIPTVDTQKLIQTSDENSRRLTSEYQRLLATNLQLKAFSVTQTVRRIPPVELMAKPADPRASGPPTEAPSFVAQMRNTDKQFATFVDAFR